MLVMAVFIGDVGDGSVQLVRGSSKWFCFNVYDLFDLKPK